MADAVGQWLHAAGRVPLLTPAEELHLGALVRRWQDWPGGPDCAPAAVRRRGLRARERMLTANLRLVVNVANRYRSVAERRGLEFADLLQEGAIGLARGVERFDPQRGFKASTYLHWWIRQAVGRAVDVGGVIRLPTGTASKLRQLTPAELQALPAAQRERLQAAIAAQRINRLDGPALGDGDSCPLVELVAADAPDPLDGLEAIALLDRMREQLPDDLALVELAQDHGSAELAAALGCARPTVASRLAMARQRLRAVA